MRSALVTAEIDAACEAAPFTLTQLETLESEAVHIFREVAGEFEHPVLLFSGGKDSVVMLHAARKAFWPAPFPFTLLHVDTGHNFPEVIDYRDAVVTGGRLRLVVASVPDAIEAGVVRERPDGSRNALQTVPLLEAIGSHRFDAVFGGGRRDEEKARAKERVFSVRVFPLSNWTELDVWRYIERERIDLPAIYFAHERDVFQRDGMWLAPGAWGGPRGSEVLVRRRVRYRTVGDMSCTGAVESDAGTVADVIAELATSRLTERGATRGDDRASEAAMEDRKREGYF